MELSEYIQIINRRKKIIILTTLFTVLVTVIGQIVLPQTYEATTILRIVPYIAGQPAYTQNAYVNKIVNTYVKIASSNLIVDEMKQRLGLGTGQPENITVRVIPDSELLLILVEDGNPALAQRAANSMVEVLLEERLIQDIRVYLVESADLPTPPSMSELIKNGILGFIIGFTGSIGLALLFELLDPVLYTKEQISSLTQIPILGEIPINKSREMEASLYDSQLQNDSFQRLRTNILYAAHEKPIKAILVTSAEPNEGKSTISVNFAKSLAYAGYRTIVIDADLYHPALHKIFDLPNGEGLSLVMKEIGKLTKSIQTSPIEGMKLLFSGSMNTEPADIINAEQFSKILKRLDEEFDYIIIDSPAFFGVADSAILSKVVDAVLLVVRCGRSEKAVLRAVIQELEKIQVKPLGIVVNQTKKSFSNKFRAYYQSNIPLKFIDDTNTENADQADLK